MPDALPLTGLFGKVPAHGDFVRRGLPTSFVGPWDSWLQEGMATARARLGDRWAAAWDGAPPWRFALPAGACGPDAVAGVLLPSEDMVGRRFPITLAVLLPPGDPAPSRAWFAALEAAALAGRAGQDDADALAAAIPLPGAEPPEAAAATAPAGWSPAEPTDPPPLPIAAAPDDDALPPIGDLRDILGSEVAPADALDAPDDAAPDTTGNVLDLFGDAGASPAAAAASAPVGDVLDIFSRALPADEATPVPALPGSVPPPHMATPDAPVPAPSDGTLAFLLGEGGTAAVAAPTAPAGEGDPLAALIAAGDAPLRMPADDAAPMVEALPAAPLVAAFDPLPPAAAVPASLPPAEPPEPPQGGGWWTGGGGRLPPSARPLPGLLPAADFVSLLEADA